MNAVRKAPPRPYAASVYEMLREEILTGVLAPGARILELEVAARLGVSQGPVREALARLKEQDLVTRVPNTGTFVTELPIEEARDVYRVRLQLERFALRLAAARIGEPELAELERLVDQMVEAARAEDVSGNIARDLAFHRRLFEWAGSATALRFWDVIEAQIRKFVAVASPRAWSDPVAVARTHLVLIDLLRARDVDALMVEIEAPLGAIWHALGEEEVA